MVPKVVDVVAEAQFVLRVTFDDGVVTEVDLSDDLWGPMMEPLKDPEYFAMVQVDPVTATVVWPNGLDLDPLVLHGEESPASPSSLSVRVIERRLGG